MSKNQADLPYTEIVERVAQITRLLSTNDLSRVRGAINDVYVRELSSKEDWTFLLVSSSIACTPEYKTGTASVNTQAATVTFSSDTVLDATFTGRKIKFNTNPNVYDFTFSNTTAGTINPPLSGSNNISSDAFNIFQPAYLLAPDFDRFPKNGGLLMYQGGRTKPIPEKAVQDYYDEYFPNPGTPGFCRLISPATDGTPRVELVPPPNSAFVIGYEYIRRLKTLRETTSGFISSIDAKSTTVVGSAGTTLFTEGTTGDYFRVSAFGLGDDSEWFKIGAITHNSSLALVTAFGLSAATTTGYTICSALEIPTKMQPAILYGAVRTLLADQNDPNVILASSMFTAIISDGKRMYKARIYNQEVDMITEEYRYRR